LGVAAGWKGSWEAETDDERDDERARRRNIEVRCFLGFILGV
jgi:hypothetical protein